MLTEEQKKYLTAHYPNTPNRVLGDVLGYSAGHIHTLAKKLNLNKDIKYKEQLKKDRLRDITEAHRGKPSAYWLSLDSEQREMALAKMKEGRLNRIKSERRRMLFGLEPKTTMRVSLQSRKEILRVAQARFVLRQRGYVCGYGGKVFYSYNSTKIIKPQKEEIYKTKYGFKFIHNETYDKPI